MSAEASRAPHSAKGSEAKRKAGVRVSMATKLTLMATAIAMFAVIVVALVSFFSMSEMLAQSTARSLHAEVSRQSDSLAAAIERVRIDAHYISSLEEVEYLARARTDAGSYEDSDVSASQWEERLLPFLSNTLGSRGYRQIQLLDVSNSGRELLRVSRDPQTQKVAVSRYDQWSRELRAQQAATGTRLKRGQVFASPITLHQRGEHDDSTGLPCQWFASPVFLDEGSTIPEALIVVTTFMDPILDNSWDLRSSFDVLLADQTGGYFHHSDSSLEWSYEPVDRG